MWLHLNQIQSHSAYKYQRDVQSHNFGLLIITSKYCLELQVTMC